VKVCEVRIYGQTYTLRADLDETEVRRVADIVDKRMTDVATAAPSASALQVAVLAAMDLAGERAAEPAYGQDPALGARVEEKLDSMLRLIDSMTADCELA